MSDGAMCHECRRYHCECPSEDVATIDELAEIKAERDRYRAACERQVVFLDESIERLKAADARWDRYMRNYLMLMMLLSVMGVIVLVMRGGK